MNRRTKPLKNESGAALVVVLCLLAVLMVLAFMMLLSASGMVGSAKKSAIFDRCRIMAQTFDEMAASNLETDGNGKTVPDTYEALVPDLSNGMEKLGTLAMRSMMAAGESKTVDGGILFIAPDEERTEAFAASASYEAYVDGTTQLDMNGYEIKMTVWLSSEDKTLDAYRADADTLANENAGSFPNLYKTQAYDGVELHTEIICKYENDDIYKIHTVYTAQITADAGNTAGEKPVFYWKWIKGRSE